MSAIKLENVSKEYGLGDNKVKALKSIKLEIEQGEFVSIVGCSGSGKSTLLNMISGLDVPTSGHIYIDGNDISGYDDKQMSKMRREKIGIIFQAYNLLPILTVYENIKMPVLLDRKKPDKKYIEELIEILGLKDRANHLPNELSGGQQQRVCIGRALANRPTILLADEPTGNLDKKNKDEVMELIKTTAKKYNQTVILITHEKEIADMANRVIRIDDGNIISDRWAENE